MADKDKKPKPKISKYMEMLKEDKKMTRKDWIQAREDIPIPGRAQKPKPGYKPFAGGGRAMRGYGKAYMKGGRVK